MRSTSFANLLAILVIAPSAVGWLLTSRFGVELPKFHTALLSPTSLMPERLVRVPTLRPAPVIQNGASDVQDSQPEAASTSSRTKWWAYRDGNESAPQAIDGCDPLNTSPVERRLRPRRSLSASTSAPPRASRYVCMPPSAAGSDGSCVGGGWALLRDDYDATVLPSGSVLAFPRRALLSNLGGGTRSLEPCDTDPAYPCESVMRWSAQLPAARRLAGWSATFAWRAAVREWLSSVMRAGYDYDVLVINAKLRLAESCGIRATGCSDADGKCVS